MIYSATCRRQLAGDATSGQVTQQLLETQLQHSGDCVRAQLSLKRVVGNYDDGGEAVPDLWLPPNSGPRSSTRAAFVGTWYQTTAEITLSQGAHWMPVILHRRRHQQVSLMKFSGLGVAAVHAQPGNGNCGDRRQADASRTATLGSTRIQLNLSIRRVRFRKVCPAYVFFLISR